jgi:hypothetical protein
MPPDTTIFKGSIHAHLSNYKVKNVADAKENGENEESGCLSNASPNGHFYCIHAVALPVLAARAGDSRCTGRGAI